MKIKLILISIIIIFAVFAGGCLQSENNVHETLVNQTYKIKLIESYSEHQKMYWIIHYVNISDKIAQIEAGDLPYTGKYAKETIQIDRVNDSQTYLVYEKNVLNQGYMTHIYTLHMGDDIRILGTDHTYREARSTVETSTGQIYP